MSQSSTRRDFLKASGWAVAAGALTTNAAGWPLPADAGGAAPGQVAVWVTGGSQRYAQAAAVAWKQASGAAENVIVLDPEKKYQEILGFGAAFTDASCYMFNQLSPAAREQLLHQLFHPSEAGFSVSRLCLGSSDYATKEYSYDDGEADPELERFSIAHDREYILPILRQTRTVNPDLFLLGSPWSPPGCMKANGSMLGGSMRKKHFASFARYLIKFLQAYAAEGVKVDAITTQNEVDTDQDCRMPACLWGQEYEIEFIARHFGPALAKTDLATKIWILDHNYNLWGRAICTLDEPEVAKYVDGIAWHGYAGRPDMMTLVHDAHPTKHAYWTEGGPHFSDASYLDNWTDWSANFAAILRNWCRCIIGWNLALDEKGRPNIGPFSCAGIVTINSATRDVIRSGMYWALAHHSRIIRRGARRFESEGAVDGVSHVAFANPGGTSAVILTNKGPARAVHLHLAGRMADVDLPKDSITSVTWR